MRRGTEGESLAGRSDDSEQASESRPGEGRILLDCRPLQGGDALRGKGAYVRGLLGGLLQEGWGDRLGLLIDSFHPAPDVPRGHGLVMYRVHRRYRGRLSPWEDAAVLGRDLAAIRPRLFHATSLLLPGRTDLPVAATVHDLIPWAFGGAAMLGERVRWAPGRRRLARLDAVVAVSAATARDAELFAGVDPARITVVPEAADPAFSPVAGASGERWGIRRPFLLYAGALDARKDPRALLEAWRVARAEGADCDLVLAGSAGAQAPAGMEGAIALGHLPLAELVELMSAASCLVFPSRYEGFGLPVLEAMACGCPVVAYRNSSIPEVAGEAGILVEDGDAAALGREAARVLLDPSRAAAARAAGLRRARAHTWRDAARQTAAVWKDLLR